MIFVDHSAGSVVWKRHVTLAVAALAFLGPTADHTLANLGKPLERSPIAYERVSRRVMVSAGEGRAAISAASLLTDLSTAESDTITWT